MTDIPWRWLRSSVSRERTTLLEPRGGGHPFPAGSGDVHTVAARVGDGEARDSRPVDVLEPQPVPVALVRVLVAMAPCHAAGYE